MTASPTDTASAPDMRAPDRTMQVIVVPGTDPGKFSVSFSPDSVTFHAKHKPRVLECLMVEDDKPTDDYVFVSYVYNPGPGIVVSTKAKGLGTSKLKIEFEFEGQKVPDGHLTFDIEHSSGARFKADPQVGNDPPVNVEDDDGVC